MKSIARSIAIAVTVVSAHHVDSCQAQVTQMVQLPTVHVTGVATTVIVPDRGSVFLGGVHRASRGRSRYGTPLLGRSNRSYSRSSTAGGFSIHATIIDHDEIDRALLAEAARRRGAKFDIRGRAVADAPPIPRDVVGQRWAAGTRARHSPRNAPPTPY